MDKYKQAVTATVDAEFDHLWKLASYIHANPEIAFEEKKAASALSSYLHGNRYCRIGNSLQGCI